jgi:hypothetical protein
MKFISVLIYRSTFRLVSLLWNDVSSYKFLYFQGVVTFHYTVFACSKNKWKPVICLIDWNLLFFLYEIFAVFFYLQWIATCKCPKFFFVFCLVSPCRESLANGKSHGVRVDKLKVHHLSFVIYKVYKLHRFIAVFNGLNLRAKKKHKTAKRQRCDQVF